MTDALTIAAGAVEGFGTVYTGLEQSAGLLGRSLSDNSVKIIEHKYGPSAGTLAAGTFDTVGNVINLNQNIGFMTPRGLAKRTAKNAGKALVESYRPRIGGGEYNFLFSLFSFKFKKCAQ